MFRSAVVYVGKCRKCGANNPPRRKRGTRRPHDARNVATKLRRVLNRMFGRDTVLNPLRCPPVAYIQLYLPILPSTRFYHRATCARCGVLGRRGFVLVSTAGRVCREAGAQVATNQFVRDLDLGVPNANDDGRRVCHFLVGSNSPRTQPSFLQSVEMAKVQQRMARQ